MMSKQPGMGFTLAELLIALAILGVIATFAIPKILSAQQDSRSNAIAKEAAGAISTAYQLYQNAGGDTTTMSTTQLAQYFNYIQKDTSSSLIDEVYTKSSITCQLGKPCYRLANGAVIHHWGDNFCNVANTAIPFDVDPDGTYSNTTNGPGKSVRFFLYKNGRLTTEGTLLDNTQWSGNGAATCDQNRSALPADDPPWFSW
jgi:prepilin-type N-terminal cleavage/methylation domain-containing protein